MKAVFEVPVFKRKENPAGVYKICFGPQWYYIGSSKRLKTRFVTWRAKLKSGINKNKKIKEVAREVDFIRFEVLETTPIGNHKSKETEYIKKHWDDPFLLNYCPNGENNIGIKHDRHGKYVIKRRPVAETKRPVAVFGLDGELLARFVYLSEACALTGSTKEAILRQINGKMNHSKGYRYKFIDENGEMIEPRQFVSKKPPLKPKKVPGISSPPRPVIKKDMAGNVIEVYTSAYQAAKKNGIEKGNFRRLLNGKRKSRFGFIYVFA